MLLNAQAIMEADDRKHVDVEVPEWGGSVRIQAMTGTQRDRFEMGVAEAGKSGKMNTAGMRAKLVGTCLIDEEGKRLFSDKELVALGNKSAEVLNTLFWKCMEHNGMSKEDEDELVENFSDDQSEPSTSD